MRQSVDLLDLKLSGHAGSNPATATVAVVQLVERQTVNLRTRVRIPPVTQKRSKVINDEDNNPRNGDCFS